jgi:predicted nucleotidyltransferase
MRAVNEDLLQEITQRLVKQFQPEKIFLFGSYAWGTPQKDSDIDLMVIVPESRLSDYERSLLGHRCLTGLDLAKDVIVKTLEEFDYYRDIRASLEYKIIKKGKVLYDRSKDQTCAELAHKVEA